MLQAAECIVAGSCVICSWSGGCHNYLLVCLKILLEKAGKVRQNGAVQNSMSCGSVNGQYLSRWGQMVRGSICEALQEGNH